MIARLWYKEPVFRLFLSVRHFVFSRFFLGSCFLFFTVFEVKSKEEEDRAARVAKKVSPRLKEELGARGLVFGKPVFIRVFKEERELELWIKKEDSFILFRNYAIAAMSGKLGPKLIEGDGQAPEGFYYVPKSKMNPRSLYHLSFNIGFPNSYDRVHDRTGSFIMVHGDEQSIGCFAMTDEKIEEIYTLCDAALAGGQPYFRVHCFPFRMSETRMKREEEHQWGVFWKNLKEGYDWFEKKKIPPNVEVEEKRYVFESERDEVSR